LRPPLFSPLELHKHVKQLSESLLNQCLISQIEDSHSIKGMNRVYKNHAPAKQGKPEPKDCAIVETFLDMGKQLRGSNFDQTICFLTSNINDYGKASALNSPLGEDFSSINAKCANDWAWALFVLSK